MIGMRARRAARSVALAIGAALACGPSAGEEPSPVDFVRADPYPRLVIEVDAVEGLSLASDVQAALVDVVEGLVDKPGGVVVIVDDTLPRAHDGAAWSFAELVDLGDERRDLEVDGDAIKVHVLLLDGAYYGEDGGAHLGLAWDGGHVALFQEGLMDACASGKGGRGLSSQACRSAELGVLAHEFGHVFGLVNNGAPMVEPHEDPAHPGHTDDPGCLMYWAYERGEVIHRIADAVDAGTPAEEALGFCGPSLADLAALREG